MKKLILFIVGVFICGCTTLDTTGVITATPKPFAHPGMYSGSAVNGIVTYKIQADGRGVSCFRNKFSGTLFLGDLKYDGEHLYTEDGTLTVDSVSENEMKVHAAFVSLVLHKIDEPPSVCREFFSK